MARTVVALYDNFTDANRALQELVNSGFSRDDISLMANDAEGRYHNYLERGAEETSGASEGAGVGAGIGAVIGGLGGLLIGLGALTIPGIGPVLAAGPLAAALTGLAGAGVGAVAGGVAGGLLGALVDMGVPEQTAQYYAEGVRRGGTLLTVRSSDDLSGRAVEILNRFNPVDINRRASEWRQSGWQGFDPNASPYVSSAPGVSTGVASSNAPSGNAAAAAVGMGSALAADEAARQARLTNNADREWPVNQTSTDPRTTGDFVRSTADQTRDDMYHTGQTLGDRASDTVHDAEHAVSHAVDDVAHPLRHDETLHDDHLMENRPLGDQNLRAQEMGHGDRGDEGFSADMGKNWDRHDVVADGLEGSLANEGVQSVPENLTDEEEKRRYEAGRRQELGHGDRGDEGFSADMGSQWDRHNIEADRTGVGDDVSSGGFPRSELSRSDFSHHDFGEYDTDFRHHFESTYSTSGLTYDQYQPAYRYGYELANDQRYQNYDWNRVEPEARRYWDERNPGSWERFKEAVHHAWMEIKDAVD